MLDITQYHRFIYEVGADVEKGMILMLEENRVVPYEVPPTIYGKPIRLVSSPIGMAMHDFKKGDKVVYDLHDNSDDIAIRTRLAN